MTGREKHSAKWVIAFTAAYIAAASIVAWLRGNVEFVFYIVVMLFLASAIYGVHRRINLSTGLLWCLSVWGLAHMAGGLLVCPPSWPTAGETHVLYNWWIIPGALKYDQLNHVYGFGVTTWLCWQGLVATVRGAGGVNVVPTLGRLTLCAAAGMGFGALNEIVEFAATLAIPQTNVGGYANTGWDLVANMVGCILAAIWIAAAYPRANHDNNRGGDQG